jgi:DnaJ homolog subfamily C member 3
LAAEDYKAALAMDPDHTANNVHLYLGLCKTLVKLGRGKEAISSCTEALNIEGELVDALTQVKLPGWNNLYGTFVTSKILF